MKKIFICFLVCLCFPLIAEKTPVAPSFISHETCNVNIYNTLFDLKDSLNRTIGYNIKTVKDIETLLNKKGYKVIASLPANTLMLNIKSAFWNKQTEALEEDNFRMLNYDCWGLTASMAIRGQKPVYEMPYSICRETTYLVVSDSKHNYGTNILKYAVYNIGFFAPAGYNSTGDSMSDSVDAVLLGARPYVAKEYEEIPDDLGILNRIPNCCTPDDMAPWCVTFRRKFK